MVTVVRTSAGHREPAGIKVQIPWKLHQAIIRIQAQDDLDFASACLRAALVVEPAREEYKKSVLEVADAISKSRYLIQLNKSRKTIEDSSYKRGYDDGYRAGYNAGHSAGLQRFCYPCKDCGQSLYASPQNEWKWSVEKGYLLSWVHTNCLKRRA